MEYYEAKKLKDDLEESIERVGVKVGNASNSFEGNVDRIIESNERLALEQQINRATEQLISIRIAYKSGVLDCKDTKALLTISYYGLKDCFKRSSQQVQVNYNRDVESIIMRYDGFFNALNKTIEKDKKQEDDFKF